MDLVFLVGMLAFTGVAVGFIGYKLVTESIIKDLERKVAALETENIRLRARKHWTGGADESHG